MACIAPDQADGMLSRRLTGRDENQSADWRRGPMPGLDTTGGAYSPRRKSNTMSPDPGSPSCPKSG